MKSWKQKLKFFIITGAFVVLILIVFCRVFNMASVTDKDFKTYRQGVEYLKKNDFQNAYFNFTNISKTSKLYEIALLREATCADELNDYETAVKKYNAFIERYPESIFIKKVYYSLGQNYFKKNEYKKAEKVFEKIRKLSEDDEYSIGAAYYLGVITKEKNPQRAKAYFVYYLKSAPDGRFAISSAQELEALKLPLSGAENGLVGKSYFLNGSYSKALPFLNKSDMRSYWHYIFRIYHARGSYQLANKVFDEGYSHFSASIDEKELFDTLEYYAKHSGASEKEGWYKVLEKAQLYHAQGADFASYRLARLVENTLKEHFYREIYKKYPDGKFASDALSNLFWLEYKNRNYVEAKKYGYIHIKNYPNTIASPRVIFWMGVISEKQGLKNEAKAFYQKVLDEYPDDYYAFRAEKKLEFYQSSPWKTKSYRTLPPFAGTIHFPIKYTSLSDDNIALINLILKLDDYTLLNEVEKDNKLVQSWLNYKEKNYARAAILARDALAQMDKKPDFSDSVYKLAYQLHYQNDINRFSGDFGLDAFLVAALIREESYFNPKARSSAGAAGLMQLMPATASYIAKSEGIRYSSLFNPADNIELGCAYLSHARDLLNGNDLLAVASYNGGPNAVKSWMRGLNYKNLDEFIENIPYEETKNYVKKVYRTYWIYMNMY